MMYWIYNSIDINDVCPQIYKNEQITKKINKCGRKFLNKTTFGCGKKY